MPDETISIEETNKIRAELGLKPLPVPSDRPGEDGGDEAEPDGDTLAEENYRSYKATLESKREATETAKRLQRAQNKLALAKKLAGKTLADDEDAGSLDTKAWAKRQKKKDKARQANLAEAKRLEFEELDQQAEEEARLKEAYGEKDLSGLKVAHGADDFEEGRDVILTLKDSGVLADEDDELQNVNLADDAAHKRRQLAKEKAKTLGTYTGYDDDEFDPSRFDSSSGPSRAKGVLEKYDDEFFTGEERESGFRLGGAAGVGARAVGAAGGEDGEEGGARKREKVKIGLGALAVDLEYKKEVASDYLQEGEKGFKIKKKKKKSASSSSRRQHDLDEDEEVKPNADGMDVDGIGAEAAQVPQQPIERRNLDEVNLVDDDELQAALSRQRREAGRKFARDRKARLASVPAVKEEDEGGDGMEIDLGRDLANGGSSAAGGEGGLVLDDVSEFVRNITYDPLEEARKKKERADRYALEMTGKKEDSKPITVKKEEDEEGRAGLLEMEVKQEEDEELEEGEAVDEDTEMGANGVESDRPRRSRSRSVSRMSASVEDVKPKVGRSGSAEPFDPFLSGTAGEKFHSGGMAATLAILKTSGAIKPLTPEELERDRQIRQTEAQLSEQRKFEVQLAEDRAQAKLQGSKKSQTEREAENRERDRLMALKQEERMRSYNPVVDIKYTDEFGREVGPKEAWKQLSHRFHGKGSGKAKTEKRLKKIEEEKKREAQVAGDTALAAGFKLRQERTGSATMVLSVGNKGTAPNQEDFLATLASNPRPSKAKDKLSGKKAGSATPGPSTSTISGPFMVAAPRILNPSSSSSRIAALGGGLDTPNSSNARDSISPARSPSVTIEGEREGSTPAPAQARTGAGFKSIRGFAPAVSRADTPSGSDGTSRAETPSGGAAGGRGESKIRIALGAKRKAEGEPDGGSRGQPTRRT